MIPDDKRLYSDILVPQANSNGAVPGDKVLVEIIEWDKSEKYPIGKVVEVIGIHGEHNAEMRAIVLERGIAYDYPDAVVKEAEEIGRKEKKVSPEEIAKRKDFRGTLTMTIDPVDAKDFDDAISFKKLDDGTFEIGVHIADVSHYVREGTALDKEARSRGFSVYLVDRTIPMLPEVLSNELCSLNPLEDKLSFSAVFVMDINGKITSRWFGKTIINSNKRFTYEGAQESILGNSQEYHEELTILNTIAKKMRTEKEKAGAIDFEQDEIKFELDELGKPIRVFKKKRFDAHKLVEEYMLLANREVALFMNKALDKKNGAFVYRIHNAPDSDRIADLAIFVKALGYNLPVTAKGIKVKDLQSLMKQVEGKPEESLIKTASVRSMAKAVYSTDNIGHFGLAFEYYTHFTSPIRRYADLLVHRLMQRELTKGPISQGDWILYKKLTEESSEKEVRAAEAERASIKYKQVEYMKERIGKVFDGTISGVTEWGIYVEDKETRSEGMIRLRDLGDDFFKLDAKNYTVVGEKTKKKYRLGDIVKFKIMNADLERKTLDYALVS
jgi:ribonuclease R